MVKILIVEDDALLSRMYQTIFSSSEYEVRVAANGEEGLEQAREFKPTLILLDIMMPKVNGLELLKQLKADADIKNIPVVVLTNLAGSRDVELALELGAVRYLVKTDYKPRQIEEIVKGIVAGYTRNSIPSAE